MYKIVWVENILYDFDGFINNFIFFKNGFVGRFSRLQFVSHARVPILKLESRYHQNVSCDISINNLSGQMKSKFLLWISLIDRRFRDMVLLVISFYHQIDGVVFEL